MAAVTSVGIVNGVPTTGTGEVMTLDVIAAKLDTCITALQIIDNMVLAAGTAVVGKVGLNDGTNAITFTDAAVSPSAFALPVIQHPDGQNANGQTTMANSTPTTLASDQSTLSVAPDTSRILNGASGVSLTPKWAFVDATASGDTSVVALVSAKKIRVLFWEMSPEAAVNARFRSNTTSKTALYYMDGKGNGQRAGFNQAGWFETASGEALNVNLSGAVNVGVLVGYVEV